MTAIVGGGAGATVTYGRAVVHPQTAAAGTWTITHGLGRRPSSVTVYVGGDEVVTDVTTDATHVVVTFAAPTTGEVHIL